MSELEMRPITRPIRGVIRPPGSKSLTNRALIVAALADGRTRLSGVLDSQDTRVMVDSLRRLGLDLEWDQGACQIGIKGCGGRIPATTADLWLENSGTSIRFLTALCSLGTGTYRLDGNSRMRERPIGDLIDALQLVGIEARCELENGCPPVVLQGRGLAGGTTTVAGDVSSQFLSALLMVAPCARKEIEILVAGKLVSEPYVDMTLRVMQSFGVHCTVDAGKRFHCVPQAYRGTEYAIEPDASAASYFFAAAAITGGRVTVQGLSRQALQGDVGFVQVLERMGCGVEYGADSITVTGGNLRGVEIDMNAISDTAQTLAVVAPFAQGATTIRNVAHMRHKETDRIAALATELRRLGQTVIEHEDGLTIDPAPIQPSTVATYDDHRMAMSFALMGLKTAGIRIAHPECTQKTYPDYFQDLGRLCGEPVVV